jgi:hypothetical protein
MDHTFSAIARGPIRRHQQKADKKSPRQQKELDHLVQWLLWKRRKKEKRCLFSLLLLSAI